jgi:hypothetical protein
VDWGVAGGDGGEGLRLVSKVRSKGKSPWMWSSLLPALSAQERRVEGGAPDSAIRSAERQEQKAKARESLLRLRRSSPREGSEMHIMRDGAFVCMTERDFLSVRMRRGCTGD